MNIHIEEPCHENWQLMTPQEKGRHCNKCCKTVFDFTNMPTDEVVKFISQRKKDSVCGRFRPEQVVTPAHLTVTKTISDRVKQFLAALLLVFGSTLFTGCEENLQGKLIDVDSAEQQHLMGAVVPDTTRIIQTDTVPVKTDTIKNELKGKVKCIPKPEDQMIQGGATVEPEIYPKMGIVAILPDSLK